jgi:hypothetical protein
MNGCTPWPPPNKWRQAKLREVSLAMLKVWAADLEAKAREASSS